jgi:nucleoid-associated protein YgaU
MITTRAPGHPARQHHALAGLLAAVILAAGIVAASVAVSGALHGTQPRAETRAAVIHHPRTVSPAAPVTRPPEPQPAPRPVWVTVRAGQCLYSIAAAHHLTWQHLYAANRARVGADPALIHAGLKLRIPDTKETTWD